MYKKDYVILYIEHNSGPHRIVDKLFSNTRYFVIKSNNFENVEIAKSKVSFNNLMPGLIKLMYIFAIFRVSGLLHHTMKRN